MPDVAPVLRSLVVQYQSSSIKTWERQGTAMIKSNFIDVSNFRSSSMLEPQSFCSNEVESEDMFKGNWTGAKSDTLLVGITFHFRLNFNWNISSQKLDELSVRVSGGTSIEESINIYLNHQEENRVRENRTKMRKCQGLIFLSLLVTTLVSSAYIIVFFFL